MKNILVPTDFSPESKYALEAALQLAQRTGGRITLLHVLDLPEAADFSTFGGPVGGAGLRAGTATMDEVYVLKLLQVTKRRLHRLVEEAAGLAPDVPVRELLQQADLEEAVLKLIRDKGIDLVVMGAQGHTAAEHFFVGSNTEKLVRMAPCPVLSVKNPVGRFVVRNLVFPSDFSAEADRAVPELRRMQVLFPLATLHLLKVVSGPDKRAAALEKITEFAHRHHLGRYEPAVQEASSPSKGIPAFVGQSATDLVLLPTHGRTGLSRFLQSSIAEYVATHAFPPVLTFKLA